MLIKALIAVCIFLLIVVMIMVDHLRRLDDVIDQWVITCCDYEKEVNDVYAKLRELDEYAKDTRTKFVELKDLLDVSYLPIIDGFVKLGNENEGFATIKDINELELKMEKLQKQSLTDMINEAIEMCKASHGGTDDDV